MGWRVEGTIPDLPRFVIIVAPHTSNWDFIVGLFVDLAMDLDASWLGKHTIFRGPIGRFFRGLGGIPVTRDSGQNVVAQVSAEFAKRPKMVLALAPEGTRKKVEEWRTGFWYIARAAGIPIVPAALDYGRRVAVLGAPYWPSDRLDDDLRSLKSFFAQVTPKRPELR